MVKYYPKIVGFVRINFTIGLSEGVDGAMLGYFDLSDKTTGITAPFLQVYTEIEACSMG